MKPFRGFFLSFKIILNDIGGGLIFLSEVLRTAYRTPCSFRTICEQIYKVTVQSAGTTAMAGFFVGAIMTVQFTMMSEQFGALGYLGGLATSATVREVGPLLIAFMLSGKVGAFTAAELGTMKVTEQIDAIRCLGANPIQEIILPRFIGIIVSSFILLTLGLVLSTGGGAFLAMIFSGISFEEFIRHIPTILVWPSVAIGIFKCLIFATTLAAICTYKGYTTTGGAKGVGKSVVNTAVATMIGIVITDWISTMISDAALNLFGGL